MSPYKHLFFDLDRTIWDFETNSNHALTELADKYKLIDKGVDSVDAFIKEFFQINEALWDQYRRDLINKETLRYERFYRTLLKYSINDKDLTKKFGDDYVAISPLKTSLFPHALETLEYLNEKYVLHIITNGFEEVQHIKIKSCGIKKYFTEIVTSERAGFKKPDARIFEYSLSVSLADKNNSIMIGDCLIADIGGARDAGMHQVYFNPDANQHSEEVTYEISSLKELRDIL